MKLQRHCSNGALLSLWGKCFSWFASPRIGCLRPASANVFAPIIPFPANLLTSATPRALARVSCQQYFQKEEIFPRRATPDHMSDKKPAGRIEESVASDLWYGQLGEPDCILITGRHRLMSILSPILVIVALSLIVLAYVIHAQEQQKQVIIVDTSDSIITVSDCAVIVKARAPDQKCPTRAELPRDSLPRGYVKNNWAAPKQGALARSLQIVNWRRQCLAVVCVQPPRGVTVNLNIITLRSVVHVTDPTPANVNIRVSSLSEMDTSRLLIQDASVEATLAAGIIFVVRPPASDRASNISNNFGPVFLLQSNESPIGELVVVNPQSQVRGRVCFDDGLFSPSGPNEYRSITNGSSSSPTAGGRVHIVNATSLYLLGQSEVVGQLQSTQMDAASPSISDYVLAQLNATTYWIAQKNNHDFIQAVEVVTPALGMTFLNSNRELVLAMSPVAIAVISGFALTPSYRRMSTPLSHYYCSSMQKFGTSYSQFGSVSDVYVPSGVKFPLETNLSIAYGIAEDITNVMITEFKATATGYNDVLLTRQDEGIQTEYYSYYEITKTLDGYELGKFTVLDKASLGNILILLPVSVAGFATLLVGVTLFFVRRPLIRFFALFEFRQRSCIVACDAVGKCPYREGFCLFAICAQTTGSDVCKPRCSGR